MRAPSITLPVQWLDQSLLKLLIIAAIQGPADGLEPLAALPVSGPLVATDRIADLSSLPWVEIRQAVRVHMARHLESMAQSSSPVQVRPRTAFPALRLPACPAYTLGPTTPNRIAAFGALSGECRPEDGLLPGIPADQRRFGRGSRAFLATLSVGTKSLL